jgi:hypothetical protein
MEGKPKKASQSQTNSEVDKSSKGNDKEKSSQKRPSRRFRDFLAGGSVDKSESSTQSESSIKKDPENPKEKPPKGMMEGNEKDKKASTEAHEIHFSQELMKYDIYRKLRSNKEKVIKITGGIIGAIFIISGILYVMGSAFRVADNVVFGERAVLSAFLVLVGVLIIAGIFARSLLEWSFLKNIHNELEVAEDHQPKVKSSDKTSDKKEKQKGNIREKDKK